MLDLCTDSQLRRGEGIAFYSVAGHAHATEIVLLQRHRRATKGEVPRFQTGLCKGNVPADPFGSPLAQVAGDHVQYTLCHIGIHCTEISGHLCGSRLCRAGDRREFGGQPAAGIGTVDHAVQRHGAAANQLAVLAEIIQRPVDLLQPQQGGFGVLAEVVAAAAVRLPAGLYLALYIIIGKAAVRKGVYPCVLHAVCFREAVAVSVDFLFASFFQSAVVGVIAVAAGLHPAQNQFAGFRIVVSAFSVNCPPAGFLGAGVVEQIGGAVYGDFAGDRCPVGIVIAAAAVPAGFPCALGGCGCHRYGREVLRRCGNTAQQTGSPQPCGKCQPEWKMLQNKPP